MLVIQSILVKKSECLSHWPFVSYSVVIFLVFLSWINNYTFMANSYKKVKSHWSRQNNSHFSRLSKHMNGCTYFNVAIYIEISTIMGNGKATNRKSVDEMWLYSLKLGLILWTNGAEPFEWLFSRDAVENNTLSIFQNKRKISNHKTLILYPKISYQSTTKRSAACSNWESRYLSSFMSRAHVQWVEARDCSLCVEWEKVFWWI